MKNQKIFSLLISLTAIFAFSQTFSAQKKSVPPRRDIIVITTAAPAKTSPELQRRVDAFNSVWQIIKDNYFDQTFSGLDWDKIKKEYEPRVLQTATDDQLHGILQEMINRLNRSHFAIITPQVFQAIENAKIAAKKREEAAKNEKSADRKTASDETDEAADFENYAAKYGIGVDLRLIENNFVITRVDKNSTAEKAGLKIGFTVEKINDVSLAELLQKIELSAAQTSKIKKHLPLEIIEYLLNGEADSVVALSCLDETDKLKEFKVQRQAIKGETISIGENFPEQFLRFETASLNDTVGLIKFNLFALPVIENFCAALTELKSKKAIIIDLRGNTGGVLGSLVGLSGMLTEKSIDLGTSIYKVGSENLTALSKAKNFKGRIVFLVDNQTISAAEVFAAALQENNRALIVGEKTAGEALPAVSRKLATGAILFYPIANYKTRNGNFLEGRGVEPDFVVNLDRKTLLAGKDAPLETALQIIYEDKAFPKSLEGVPTMTGIGNGTPPPPPAPLKKLAEITIEALPAAAPPVAEYKKDDKSLQIIADFVTKVGGAEAFDKIKSYSLKGSSSLNVRGSNSNLEIQAFRQKPDKYAEIWRLETNGEVRQIYNGKQFFVQSDYGVIREFPGAADTSKVEIFAPIYSLFQKDFFKSLNYKGVFDRAGRKSHVIEASATDGGTVALAFDVETKLLVGYVSGYYSISIGDYRPVENLLLPFSIDREGFMKIKLDAIKLNPAIEESSFTKKENCFDKAN